MLENIRQQLIELRQQPEPDESTFEDASSLLKQANDLVILQGIQIESVGKTITPATAIAIVSGYILAIERARTTIELKNTKETAKLLNISERTLWSYAESGELPRVMLGAAVRYHRDDIQRFIEAKKWQA
jgi:excisionase family DNA binding protein